MRTPWFWLKCAFWTAVVFGFILGYFTEGWTQDSYQYYKNYDFSGGLNTATSPFLLRDNEAEDMDNFLITTEGALKTRGGFARHSLFPLNYRAVSLYRHFTDFTTAGTWFAHLVNTDGATAGLYYYDTGTSTWTLSTAFTAVDHFLGKSNFVNFLGALYVTNRYDGLGYYDSSYHAVTGEPLCRYIAVHGQRLYMAGDPTATHTFYFSALRDGTTWDSTSLAGVVAGYWTLPSFSGGNITGFANWQGMLLIFTETSVWALQGDYPEEASLQEIVAGIGCSAPESIVNMGGDVFFKHVDKVYRMANPPVDVSQKLKGFISTSDAAQAVAWDRKYVITNPTSSHLTEIPINVDILLYDVDKDRWMKWNNIPWHTACVSPAAYDGEAFLLARSDSEEVGLYTESNAYDVWGTFTTLWKTRVFHFDVPELNKKLRHFQMDLGGYPGYMDILYWTDYGRVTGTHRATTVAPSTGLGTFILGTHTLGETLFSLLKFPFVNKVMGKVFQLAFTSASVYENTIYGYVLRYRQKPFRGSAY